MKVLFDTNVVLDVLLDREPFVNDAMWLLSRVEKSEITGFVCATTITTIHYLTTKSLGRKEALRHISSLLSLFVIAPVNRIVIGSALKSGFDDFEDGVLHESALHAGARYIVTRNSADFKKSKIPVFQPRELINTLQSLEDNN